VSSPSVAERVAARAADALAPRSPLALASLFFFLSGASGLAYEVLWIKRFGQLWGSSSHALASVVAAFLCGLGLGALLAGPRADRARRPLAGYAACEIAIGLLALAVPYEIAWLFDVAAPLSASLGERPLAHALARFALTFAVVGPPCALMGATLPLLVRHFLAAGRPLGASVAWLYAANTLGAAAGAWVTGFHLLGALGVGGTNRAAALSNLAIGAGAWALARRPPAPLASDRAPLEPVAPSGERSPRWSLWAAAALSGAAALALQMLWARQLALVLGGSTYAFTAALFVFILGLGLGSLAFRLFFAHRASLRGVLAAGTLLVVLPTLAGTLLLPALARMAGELGPLRAKAAFDALLCAGVSAVLEGLPTFAMGLVFPALVQLTRQGAPRAGRAVGALYAWNTLGSLVGASLTAPLVLPAIGGEAAFRLALALVVLALVLVFPPWRPRANALPLAAALLAGFALGLPREPADPQMTNRGMYLYGTNVDDGSRTLFFEEGATCNVLVLESPPAPSASGLAAPTRSLRVNGKVDASNAGDMPMQLALAYVPHFLRPEARKVLVIGLGSGTTSGASLLFADTRVTCCEIEPAIADAARLFEPANHRPLSSPRFRLVLDDGRGHLQSTGESYDLILSEPSNPWIAGVSSLFTVEFYRAVQARLARDGLFAQWLQTYAFSPAEYALVARSLRSVFPHCVLVHVSEFDTLLLASASPLVPAEDALERAQELVQASTAVQDDLARHFRTGDVRALLLEHLALDEQGIERMLAAEGGDELHTDLNLRLELEAPRRLFEGRAAELGTLRAIYAAMDLAPQRALCARKPCSGEELEAAKRLTRPLLEHGRQDLATLWIQLLAGYAPDDPELLADELLFAPPGDPSEFEAAAAHLIELSPVQAFRAGRGLAQGGRTELARVLLEKLVVRLPDSATAWTSLGIVYTSLGRTEDARSALGKARALDPLDELTRGAAELFDREVPAAGK